MTGQLRPEGRRTFFAEASDVMRPVIVDTVRERRARRGGGDLLPMTLDTQLADQPTTCGAEMLCVPEALRALESSVPRRAQVVEMHLLRRIQPRCLTQRSMRVDEG